MTETKRAAAPARPASSNERTWSIVIFCEWWGGMDCHPCLEEESWLHELQGGSAENCQRAINICVSACRLFINFLNFDSTQALMDHTVETSEKSSALEAMALVRRWYGSERDFLCHQSDAPPTTSPPYHHDCQGSLVVNLPAVQQLQFLHEWSVR